MSDRTFKWSMTTILAMILLSIPAMPGAIIGVFFGFTIAFFIAGPGWLISGALEKNGITIPFENVMATVAALYVLTTIAIGWIGWRNWKSGNRDIARLLFVKTVLLAALPIMAYMSLNTMADNWHT